MEAENIIFLGTLRQVIYVERSNNVRTQRVSQQAHHIEAHAGHAINDTRYVARYYTRYSDNVPTHIDTSSTPTGTFNDGDLFAVTSSSLGRGASATASTQDEKVKVVS
jgi:hypothetical protein